LVERSRAPKTHDRATTAAICEAVLTLQQNGRHERFHLTLRKETTPPAATPRQQQARFDRLLREFNTERPHEAPGQQPPARHYIRSPRIRSVLLPMCPVAQGDRPPLLFPSSV
jgi:transposase InsO family protein